MLLSLLSIGAAEALLAACSASASSAPGGQPSAPNTPREAPAGPAAAGMVAAAPGQPLPPIPPPHPGPAHPTFHAPGRTQQIALTIDDGYDPQTVAGYVEFAQRSKIPITFCPNGAYRQIWDQHAPALRPLIEAGQVQIGNHTWTHHQLPGRSDADIRADVEKNEEWIQKTFGITSRPWFRPPYGAHNQHVDGVVAEMGYPRILLWNGSFGDSTQLTPDQLIGLATRYLQPGTIMLGHANHPTVLGLFDRIQQLIAERHLQPVTLDTMFGTSRATG